MKYTNSIICSVLAIIVMSAGGAFAQDKKMGMKPMPKDAMNMDAMRKDGHRTLMMAYHHNAVAFTRALWEISSDGNIENVEIARVAFSEVKRSVEKMDEVHKMHMSTMGKMDPAMTEKMKPMMEKMEAQKAAVKGHLQALESALSGSTPSAAEIEMHAATLLMKLEKMGMPGKKMEME